MKTKRQCLRLAWWLAVPLAFAMVAEPLVLKSTVSLPHVKGGFDLMAVDVPVRRLFVNAEGNNTMEVIDLAAAKNLQSVGGLHEPKWVVFRPESHKLYIAGGDGTLRILDSRSFEPIKTVNFKEKANNLRYDADTKQLFVGVGKTFGALDIVDKVRDEITGEIGLADFPKQFELDPDGRRIYVNVPMANHIAVVDRKKGAVVKTWPVAEAKENVPMGLARQRHRLFIGCEPGMFIVFDTVSSKSVASLDIAAEPDGICYDAMRKRIYVSCGSGSLDVIQQLDANHYALPAEFPPRRARAHRSLCRNWIPCI